MWFNDDGLLGNVVPQLNYAARKRDAGIDNSFLTTLLQQFEALHSRKMELEHKLGQHDSKFGQVDNKLGQVDSKLATIDARNMKQTVSTHSLVVDVAISVGIVVVAAVLMLFARRRLSK